MNNIFTFSRLAAADLSAGQYRGLKIDSNGNFARAGAGERTVAIQQNEPVLGQACDGMALGITKAEYGDDVLAGRNLTTDGNGKFVHAAGDANVACVALEAGADGENHLVLVATITQFGLGTGVVTTENIAADAIDGTLIADDAVDSEHYTDGSIDTAHIAADAIDGTLIADDAVDSEHIVAGAIDTAHLGTLSIDTAQIAADAIDGTKIADDSIDSEHYVDGSIDLAHLAADCVDGTKIADDSIDSEHYVDASIDTAHIGLLQITTALLAADAVDGTKIADDSIDSEHYVDGSIDTAHIAADAIDGTLIADDALDSEHYTDGSVDVAHLAQSATPVAVLTFPIPDMSAVANGDLVTNYPMSGEYEVVGLYWICTTPITTAAKHAEFNVEINAVNCTGGVLTLDGQYSLGGVVQATEFTANNVVTNGDTLSIEVANVTSFVEGAGVLQLILMHKD